MAMPPSVLPLGFQIAEEAGGRNTKDFITVYSYSLNYELQNQECFVLDRNFLNFLYL